MFSLVFFTLISRSIADYCLSQPSELTWTDDSDDKYVHEGTLQFTAQSFYSSNTNAPTDFTTRVFNNMLPGPTLRMKRGHEYFVTFENTLGSNDANEPTTMNTYHSPNTSNLHLHGLHISPQSPGDNVFDAVEPGDSQLYEYIIPCNHAGGTHWYHPHHHGSTTIAVGGGATGMLIVEDDAVAEGLPNWLTKMDEYVLMIHYFDFGFLDHLYNDTYDKLFQYTNKSVTSFYLLNGQYQPTICLSANKWKRFRISYVKATGAEDTFMIIDSDGKNNTCSLKLIARDGILVHGTDNTVPRDINFFWLTSSGRLDVAVNCPGNNKGQRNYTLAVYKQTNSTTGAYTLTTIATIQVTGKGSAPNNIKTFHPIRPSYLPNLLTSTVNNTWNIGISGGGLGQNLGSPPSFQGETNYLKNLTIGQTYEWNLCSVGEAHPFHMHVNHFQIYSNGTMPSYVGTDINAVGDYVDTLYVAGICPDISKGTIRFIPDLFGGTATLHCHMLHHEDIGAMATVFVNGGCNYDLTENSTSYDPTAPSCEQVAPTC